MNGNYEICENETRFLFLLRGCCAYFVEISGKQDFYLLFERFTHSFVVTPLAPNIGVTAKACSGKQKYSRHHRLVQKYMPFLKPNGGSEIKKVRL